MTLVKLCRLGLMFLIAVVSVSCTSGNYSHPAFLLEQPEAGYLAVGFREIEGNLLVVRTESKLAPRDGSSDPTTLDFSDNGFKQVSEQDTCIQLICWNLWLYEPAATQSTDEVVSEVDAKIRKAFELLPKSMEANEPYRLDVYLVPPNRAFYDKIENMTSGINELKFAVQHDIDAPSSNRALRTYQETQALSVSTLVHEFIHFIQLKTDYYEEPSSYAAVAHQEALAKCYGHLSFLRVLDSDSKVSLVALLDQKPKHITYRRTDTGTWDANDLFTSVLKKEFIEAGSKSVVGNQIILSARDELEIGIIEDTCEKLLAGEIEIE